MQEEVVVRWCLLEKKVGSVLGGLREKSRARHASNTVNVKKLPLYIVRMSLFLEGGNNGDSN